MHRAPWRTDLRSRGPALRNKLQLALYNNFGVFSVAQLQPQGKAIHKMMLRLTEQQDCFNSELSSLPTYYYWTVACFKAFSQQVTTLYKTVEVSGHYYGYIQRSAF